MGEKPWFQQPVNPRWINGVRASRAEKEPKNILDYISVVYAAAESIFPALQSPPSRVRTSSHSAADPIFPLPVVAIPGSLPRKGHKRVRARWARAELQYLNLTIVSLNYMYLGNTNVIQRRQPSACQRRFIDNLANVVAEYVTSLRGISIPGEAINLLLKEVGYNQIDGPGRWIKPEKIAIPDVTSSVNVISLLDADKDADLVQLIMDPERFIAEDPSTIIPRPTVLSSKRNLARLYDRLATAGMLDWVSADDVYQHSAQPLVSGVFAVDKSDGAQRFICALCPTNALVQARIRQLGVDLPSIKDFRFLKCGSEDQLVIFKRDVKDCFHNFGVEFTDADGIVQHKWKRFWGLFADAHVGKECTTYPASGGRFIPCLKTLPMGWSGSVHLVQRAMVRSSLRAGLPPQQQLCSTQAVNTLPAWLNVLDDFCVLATQESADVGRSWSQRVHEQWKAAGIPEHPGKTIDGDPAGEVIGHQVKQGTRLGLSYEKSVSLQLATLDVLARWSVQRKTRARLQGKMVHAFLPRRCLLSIFTSFRAYEKSTNPTMKWLGHEWLEMLIASILLPFGDLNLAAPWNEHVVTSDACVKYGKAGLGVCSTRLPPTEVERLAVSAQPQGFYSMLDPAIPQPPRSIQALDLDTRAVHWDEWVSHQAPCHRHITWAETKGARLGVMGKATRPHCDGQRHLHGVDATATYGALNKGRSSSRDLNGECRKVCVLSLVTHSCYYYGWLSSRDNHAADRSSRKPFYHRV